MNIDVILMNDECVKEVVMTKNLKDDLVNKGNHLVNRISQSDAIVLVSCIATGLKIEQCLKYIDIIMNIKQKSAKLIISGCLTNILDDSFECEDIKIIRDPDFVIPIENYLLGEQNKNSYQSMLKNRTRYLFDNNTCIQFMLESGCTNGCTFCKYNYKEKKIVSIPYHVALDHLKAQIKNGTKSIILNGETLNLYGVDLYNKPILHQFIHDLSLIDGLERISLYELTIQNMYPELLEEIINNPKVYNVCIQLEMATDKLLKLMNRGHTIEEYLSIIEKIQESGKHIHTVLMSSFPKEDYSDLDYTIDFVTKNNILVDIICRYQDYECIPSHNLEQLSYNESRKHFAYLKEKIAISNKIVMMNKISELEDSIVIAKPDDKTIIFDNFVTGYTYRKKYQDCSLGECIQEKPKMIVKNQINTYSYLYRY